MANIIKQPKSGLIERKYTTKFNNYNSDDKTYYPETPYYKFSPPYNKKKNQFSYIKSFSSYTPKRNNEEETLEQKDVKPQKYIDYNVFNNVKTLLDSEKKVKIKSQNPDKHYQIILHPSQSSPNIRSLSTQSSQTLPLSSQSLQLSPSSQSSHPPNVFSKSLSIHPSHQISSAQENIQDKSKQELLTIYSVGIACCRIININNNNIPQILLVQKKITYGFCNFVYGDYKIDNKEEIKKLLNKMTVEEKIDITTGDFDRLWYKIWMDTKDRKKIKNNNRYYNCKRKFEELYEKENGEYLKKMIEKSHNINLIWEIPKGKKRKNEIDILAATREFQEETNISKSMFKIFPNTTFKYEFIDNNVKYKLLYYAGIMNKIYEPSINMGSIEQLKEITDIKFMSIVDIRRIDYDGHLEKKIIPILNFIKSNN